MGSLDRLAALDAAARLRSRDATLFSADSAVQADVMLNLGWTELVADASPLRGEIDRIAARFAGEGITDVVLLGMGGSSLASLVVGAVLGDGTGPRLHVLDTTSPVTARATLDDLPFATTLFLVASKSGTTIEPLSLYAVFRAAADSALGTDAAGARFIAITDPGTPLETLARESGFAEVVNAPATVGGRYSALTIFGLLPAALIGVDLDVLLDRAAPMEAACAMEPSANPAAKLAAFAVEAHAAGKDKLTVIASSGLETFGLWVEQLVAESLGKEGTGIVPVVELAASKPTGYGTDRALAVVRFESDDRLAQWAQEWRAHHPVHELVLRDAYDLGAEFVRWTHAVAFMGPLLGVNPFGQPNVAAAKAATAGVLDGSVTRPEITTRTESEAAGITFAGTLDAPAHAEANLGTALGHAVASLQTGDYLGILAYLPDDTTVLEPLTDVVPAVAAALGVPVTLELGPRYLHSTGQLHKGGPDTGVFVLVSTDDPRDVEVPGKSWGLRALHRAQAAGDLVTLSAAGRRVLWIDLADAEQSTVAALARGLADAAGIVTEET